MDSSNATFTIQDQTTHSRSGYGTIKEQYLLAQMFSSIFLEVGFGVVRNKQIGVNWADHHPTDQRPHSF